MGVRMSEWLSSKIFENTIGRHVRKRKKIDKNPPEYSTLRYPVGRKLTESKFTAVAIHCSIRAISWLKIIGQALFWSVLQDNWQWSAWTAWHSTRESSIPSPSMPNKTYSMRVLKPQVPHHYRWQMPYTPTSRLRRNSRAHRRQFTSWPHATDPSLLSPVQLVITIALHESDWIPMFTSPPFLYWALALSVQVVSGVIPIQGENNWVCYSLRSQTDF